MNITWKMASLGAFVAISLGFVAGRMTNQATTTSVVDTKTSEVREVENKLVVDVVADKVVVVEKGPTRTRTKKKVTRPTGEVEESETVVEEGPVKVVETDKGTSKLVVDEKSKTAIKTETRTETTSTPPRNWLVGGSVSYGLTDALQQQWQKPDVEIHAGYRIFGGSYFVVQTGFDVSNQNVKLGVGLNVTF